MKHILKVLVLLMSIYSMAAFTHTEVYETYKSVSYNFDGELRFTATMENTVDRSEKGITVYGQPYTLIIDVSSPINVDSLSFRNVYLNSESEDKPINLSHKEISFPKCIDGCTVTVLFELESLEYKPYIMAGVMELNGKSYSFELTLETDYRKQRVNRLWKNLMGI